MKTVVKTHTKVFKSKLLHARFYLDLGWLKTMFVEFAEGWKQYCLTQPGKTLSYEAMDIDFMEKQSYELFSLNHRSTILDSIFDYINIALDQSENFNGSEKVITIVLTHQINIHRRMTYSSLPNISLIGLPSNNGHSKELYEAFNRANQHTPVAEPIDMYFGVNTQTNNEAMPSRGGVEHYPEIENRIYHALYLWCVSITPDNIDCT